MRGEWTGYTIRATDEDDNVFLVDTDGLGVQGCVSVEVRIDAGEWSVWDSGQKIPITRVTKNPEIVWEKSY